MELNYGEESRGAWTPGRESSAVWAREAVGSLWVLSLAMEKEGGRSMVKLWGQMNRSCLINGRMHT